MLYTCLFHCSYRNVLLYRLSRFLHAKSPLAHLLQPHQPPTAPTSRRPHRAHGAPRSRLTEGLGVRLVRVRLLGHRPHAHLLQRAHCAASVSLALRPPCERSFTLHCLLLVQAKHVVIGHAYASGRHLLRLPRSLHTSPPVATTASMSANTRLLFLPVVSMVKRPTLPFILNPYKVHSILISRVVRYRLSLAQPLHLLAAF